MFGRCAYILDAIVSNLHLPLPRLALDFAVHHKFADLNWFVYVCIFKWKRISPMRLTICSTYCLNDTILTYRLNDFQLVLWIFKQKRVSLFDEAVCLSCLWFIGFSSDFDCVFFSFALCCFVSFRVVFVVFVFVVVSSTLLMLWPSSLNCDGFRQIVHNATIFGSHLSLFNIFQNDQTLFGFNAIEMDLLVTLMHTQTLTSKWINRTYIFLMDLVWSRRLHSPTLF